ncbi:MAG: hypothetical protein ABIP39_05595 [Polyangiaceae bacterium]
MTRCLWVIACAAALAFGCSQVVDDEDRPPVSGDCSGELCKVPLDRGAATPNPPAGNGNAGASATTDGGPLPNPPVAGGQTGGISGGNPPGGQTGVGGINGAAGSNGTGGLVDFDASIGLGPGIPQ